MPPRKTLTRSDWAAAGLAALVRGGPDAVAIEPVAASLGATKGSAYWHFAGRAELLDAVLERWIQEMTIDVIAAIEAGGGTPVQRLSRLLAKVVDREGSPAEMLLIASADPAVRSAVAGATRRRVAYIEQVVRDSGVPKAEARTRAVLAYAAYLGHGSLTSAVPDLVPDRAADRMRMQQSLLALAVPVSSDVSR